MNKKVFLAIVSLVFIASCANKVTKEFLVSDDDLYFEFVEPQSYKKKSLPNGRYRCYLKDENGCFFEAPATLKEGMFFSRGQTGGVYVTDNTPIEAYLYFQDKHPTSTYVDSVGFISIGGSGYYRVGELLPENIISVINIKKGP